MKCEEAVGLYMQTFNDSLYIPSDKNNRLWGHDFVHSLFHDSPLNGKGEERAAIHMAVILRDMEVNPSRKKKWADAGQDVTLDGIKNELLPKLVKFRAGLLDKSPSQLKTVLTDQQILFEMKRAKMFGDAVFELLGRRLGEIQVEDLKDMEYSFFVDILEKIDRSIPTPSTPRR